MNVSTDDCWRLAATGNSIWNNFNPLKYDSAIPSLLLLDYKTYRTTYSTYDHNYINIESKLLANNYHFYINCSYDI